MRGFRSVSRSINAIARENRRMQDAALALERAQLRDEQIAARAAVKAAKQGYLESREGAAQEQTATIQSIVATLSSILLAATRRHFAVDFEKLKVKPKRIPFNAEGYDKSEPAPSENDFAPPPLSFLQRFIPAFVQKHDQAIADGHALYGQAVSQYKVRESERSATLGELKAKHVENIQSEKDRVANFNAAIDENAASYRAGELLSVVDYFTTVLEDDIIFQTQPPTVKITYVPESKQLVVEYQLPTIDVVPANSAVRYVRKSDELLAIPRKLAEIRNLYRDVLAQVTCRALYSIVDADTARTVEVIALNGFVDTIAPGTGKRITPTIISVRALAAELRDIDFARVEPIACLVGLKALISRSAHELEPVRPIVNFNMVDHRFIDKTDILSNLDSRPNIAELSPSEFESLMTNLFEKMGLETRLTQASRDGGVDCVAWDMRPVVGGKVVIQAKRYKNTVGVSAVRDLFGTMMNEGAAKGILVTTSGFGASAYDFAKNKPIELVTGSNLLSMLSEYADINAKIDFPQGWEDENPRMSEAEPVVSTEEAALKVMGPQTAVMTDSSNEKPGARTE